MLKEGKPLPEGYRWLLFEGKQETYVLTKTMAVPLQKVKVFGDVKDDEWHNMLILDEAVIRIKDFKINIISKKPIPEEELRLKSLSMVIIDYDYNGEYF